MGSAGTAGDASRRGRARAPGYLAPVPERGRILALSLPTPADGRREIDAALERHGLRARRVEELAPADPIKRGRSAWRIALDDGRTLKARLLESAEAARRLHERRGALGPAFPPSLGHAGRVVLEEWIAGVPLAEPETWIEPAARLLAELHATPLPAAEQSVATTRWREEAARDLAHLADAGALSASERERLDARLADADPRRVSLVVAHRDFCAENMIVDAAGALRVIDNEWLDAQPAGIDLARTRCRWPMPADAWRRFLAVYRAHAPGDPGPLAFWEIPALAWTARVRLRRSPEHAASAVAQLCAIGADGEPPP